MANLDIRSKQICYETAVGGYLLLAVASERIELEGK